MKTLIKAIPILALTVLLSGVAISAGKNKRVSGKTQAAAAGARIEWLSYDAGLAKAKEEGKPIVIDFYTSWCGYCKKMDRTTFRDPKVVQYIKENMVAIRVNGDSRNMVSHKGERMTERALTKVYGVRGYPTFWFLDSNGDRIGPAPGYKPTSSFFPLLRYVGDNHYKTMSYERFVKSKHSKS